MRIIPTGRLRRALGAFAAATIAAAAPARLLAQSHDGFLFGAPRATLSVRGGFDRASAGSDLFDDAISQYSLSRGSFSGGTFAADLAVRLTPRVALVLGSGYSGGGAPSHVRDLIGSDDREIEQSTSFGRIPITLGARAYLTPTGRSIGRYAWIPARASAFVGAGVGMMHYKFQQSGDFVDFAHDSAVVSDRLVTSGWAPTAHGLVGFDYSLSPSLALTGEGRYTWARGDVNQDYLGFDRIDLSGLAATVGLSVRF